MLIGVAMFGSTVYLSLYFQRAKDMSPTEAGLMSICMVGGLLVSSIVSGRIISATGLWKRWLVGGMVAVIAGLGLLSTIDADTPLWHTGIFMAVLGLGLGARGARRLVVALEGLLEHRILLELLLDEPHELQARQLEQLDRLLQLGRHHQLLGQA